MTYEILTGDCLTHLRTIKDECIHCCITSPSYFGLRDYGVEGQIGLEKSPEEYVNSLVGYICSRRGKVLNMETKGKQKVICAEVPLAEMFGYATNIRSLSSGRASASMEFSKYMQVPAEIAEKILAEKKEKETKDNK